MKAKYIGGESNPGSGSTVAFGMTVRCGEVFDVPAHLEGKVSRHPAFEVVMDAPPAMVWARTRYSKTAEVETAPEPAAEPAKKPRKSRKAE